MHYSLLMSSSSCYRSLYPPSLYLYVYTRHPMKSLLGINAEGPLCHCFGCLGVWGHLDVFHLIHTGEQTTHIFVGTDHLYLGVLYQMKWTYIYKYTFKENMFLSSLFVGQILVYINLLTNSLCESNLQKEKWIIHLICCWYQIFFLGNPQHSDLISN